MSLDEQSDIYSVKGLLEKCKRVDAVVNEMVAYAAKKPRVAISKETVESFTQLTRDCLANVNSMINNPMISRATDDRFFKACCEGDMETVVEISAVKECDVRMTLEGIRYACMHYRSNVITYLISAVHTSIIGCELRFALTVRFDDLLRCGLYAHARWLYDNFNIQRHTTYVNRLLTDGNFLTIDELLKSKN